MFHIPTRLHPLPGRTYCNPTGTRTRVRCWTDEKNTHKLVTASASWMSNTHAQTLGANTNQKCFLHISCYASEFLYLCARARICYHIAPETATLTVVNVATCRAVGCWPSVVRCGLGVSSGRAMVAMV